MSNKAVRNLLITVAILMFGGAVVINWLSAPSHSSIDIQAGDEIDFGDDTSARLPMLILVSPILTDSLTIDWLGTLFITDALSQTTIIQGPATVRFSEEGQ